MASRQKFPEVVTPMGDIGPPRIRHLGPLHIRGTPVQRAISALGHSLLVFALIVVLVHLLIIYHTFIRSIAILSRGHIRTEQENGLCSIKYVTLDIMSFSAGYQKIFLI